MAKFGEFGINYVVLGQLASLANLVCFGQFGEYGKLRNPVEGWLDHFIH
jgi:hypothetical protein